MLYSTDDLRIVGIQEVLPPAELHEQLPITDVASETVFNARKSTQDILHQRDDRLIVIIGPCSIHDPNAARDYANRLQPLISELAEDLHIIMRVYFEKPRSVVGWKGLINDPYLDGSFKINDGLHIARKLLLDLAEMGVPAASEYLDLISPQYISDLVSWGAIGARTTESQAHRELASGLSCPVGFKNATDGGMQIAVDACLSASRPHHFMSVTKSGHSAIFSTTGNPDCHVILRGGKQPNYDADSINQAAEVIAKSDQPVRLMIDCSHANSGKSHIKQPTVCREVKDQVAAGDSRIIGLMLESNLVGGRQNAEPDKPLVYGQSITDACMAWDDSVPLLYELAEAVRSRRQKLA
ncbi:2-keto-3-deoxy-D-arabino-heptulosonate-7- phosphate synthase I alpha [Methylophaga frappieri]|uniref:Phospho-2-dehydro-3-deoxyheptonate aldolase n=1 Tax=Methylophaga frappieri (strain ATCC BAA-2434 / DSM 25690 / JAM7) TaxID=754477 RepID=I1YH64_METFJ|nr:3-deoxy-7-phosphoheptulonate synthase [Methylophaga frappieri]AFJ02257.1 2-keto-3-deoxy-D-arabino-heptulosonate-7- phosphate synthase I alpha [Methylophaga frappieri]